MKLYDIYPRIDNKINVSDLASFKMPLEISDIEVTGETKKTVWASFVDLSLKLKCTKKDVFEMCNHFRTDDTDDLVGKKIYLKEDDEEKVIVFFPTTEKKTEKKK